MLVQFEVTTPTPVQVLWGGIKMVTRRPCKNPLVIASKEIFSRGTFAVGTYQRQVEVPISRNIIPSVTLRNITYSLDASVRLEKVPDSEEEIEIMKSQPVVVEPLYDKTIAPHPNSVHFSLGGLTVTLNKDVYRVGEAIKVSYVQQGFRHLSAKLMQDANVLCSCPQYGGVCTVVEQLPAVVANASKKDLTAPEGFLLLKIPKVSEPSHAYEWKPTAETFWGHSFGDVSEWFIQISGHPENPALKPVKFQVPITISPAALESQGNGLFEPTDQVAPFKVKARSKEAFEVTRVDFDATNRTFEIRITNCLSEKILEGVTIRVTGMQSGLFETSAFTFGLGDWAPGEEKVLQYRTHPNISNLFLLVEDNDITQTRVVASTT